jgi:hypothetical protein
MDNDFDGGEFKAASVYFSPLSEPVNIIIFKANSRVTNSNIISFNSTESIDPKYIYLGGKTYLAVDYITNIRKGTAPS